MKKEERTCVQCHKKLKYGVAIQNTNIAFAVLVDKPLYKNDDMLISICHNPKCPNYGLLQISNEKMPNK
jgi:hypothetical protein